MTDKEILIKAIKIAINNGCTYNTYDINIDLWLEKKLYYSVIFSHDFAKGFWGEKIIDTLDWYPWPYPTIERWRYELGLLVMAENPLKHLEDFL